MYSLEQYPHTLSTLVESRDLMFSPEGDPLPPRRTERVISRCRCQTSGAGKITLNSDGERVSYDWLIHIPKGIDKINAGELIIIRDKNNSKLAEGRVIKHAQEQLHDRIWI